jgi:hypothetical protein
MGFNNRYLPELKVLLERRKKYKSDEEFLNDVIGKSDSLSGSYESVEYITSLYLKIREIKNEVINRK